MSTENDLETCPVCEDPISKWMRDNWNVLRSKLHPMAYLELCRYAASEGLPHPNEQTIICGHCFIELSFGIAGWDPINFASDDVVTIKTINTKKEPLIWGGSEPKNCDHCGQPFSNERFIDGRLIKGRWGLYCTECYAIYGAGFGVGNGRLYVKQGDEWVGQAYPKKGNPIV